MSGVELVGLTVQAGKKVLVSEVSLVIGAGTWCTLVGPNGAGKTTLVEAIAGLRHPTHGTVSIGGTSVAAMSDRERARSVALVPQHPIVPSGMTVYDYVALGRTAYHGLFRAPGADDRRIVESVLERLSLGGFRDRDVVTLSGGERQRMVLGRAFAQSTTLTQRVVERTIECIAHQVKRVQEVTLARPIGSYQIGQRPKPDIAIADALVIAQHHACDENGTAHVIAPRGTAILRIDL